MVADTMFTLSLQAGVGGYAGLLLRSQAAYGTLRLRRSEWPLLRVLVLFATRTQLHVEFRGSNSVGLLVLRNPPWGLESGVDGRPIPLHAATHELICTIISLPGQRGH